MNNWKNNFTRKPKPVTDETITKPDLTIDNFLSSLDTLAITPELRTNARLEFSSLSNEGRQKYIDELKASAHQDNKS